jgi:hypothetical protein
LFLNQQKLEFLNFSHFGRTSAVSQMQLRNKTSSLAAESKENNADADEKP